MSVHLKIIHFLLSLQTHEQGKHIYRMEEGLMCFGLVPQIIGLLKRCMIRKQFWHQTFWQKTDVSLTAVVVELYQSGQFPIQLLA